MGATITLPFLGSVGEAAFAEGYGLVEVGGGVAAKFSPPYLGADRMGRSVGFTLPGYRTRVVDDAGRDVAGGDVGELLVQGPGVLKGYWGDAADAPDILTEDGWLRTGDLVRRGPFRTLMFEGRKKHVIMRGGYSVYAVEVEQALERHPAIAEAAVVGLPDERMGEVPAAVVRLAPGEWVGEDELLAWAGEHLAEYKVPVRAVFVDELPRTGTTKVQKDELRALFT
jgi:acyl-CoA synthetase (AMP-forming)/AMP-acid ligase II